MSAPDPTGLAGLFVEVTDNKLLQAVALIDGLPERGAVDELLAPMRPRLQQLRPPRPLTLRRILTLPFEELLVPAADWRPGMPRLSRDFLGSVHQIVLSGLEPERLARIDRMVGGHTMHDKAVLARAGEELWPAAAALVRAALPPDAAGGDGRGRNRRQQLALAAELLGIGGPLAGVFLSLPEKPVRRLDDAQKQRIGELLRHLERLGGSVLALGAEALGQRLADPGVLLEVMQRSGEGSAIRQAAASEAGRRVLAELDHKAEQLRRAGRQPAVALADELAGLVGTVSALEAGPADLPVDRARLGQVACKAAKAIEGHLRNVVHGEVLDGFRALGSAGIDDEAIAAVEAAARAARKLGAAGRQLAMGGQVDLVMRSAFAAFRRGLDEPIVEGSDAGRVMDRLRIVEIVFGADAAAGLLKARLDAGKR